MIIQFSCMAGDIVTLLHAIDTGRQDAVVKDEIVDFL